MKRLWFLTILIMFPAFVAACAGSEKYHKTDLPDPKSYNAHFGDMDADGDEFVNWGEFTAYFQHAEKAVFDAVDLNQDGNIDHDEWHEFKEAHGLEHIE